MFCLLAVGLTLLYVKGLFLNVDFILLMGVLHVQLQPRITADHFNA